MADKCIQCGSEIVETTSVFNKKDSKGLEIRVVNVPAKACKCKNNRAATFSFNDLMIIEEYTKNMKEHRNIIDFKEIQEEYKGISAMDIIEKKKKIQK